MALSFAYDGRIVIVKMVGEYALSELRDVVTRALEDRACPANRVMLLDLRESLAIERRSTTEVADMARLLPSINPRPNRRVAMVVSQNVAFGLMRLGSVFAAQAGVLAGVFREVEAARAWLLDPNALPQT